MGAAASWTPCAQGCDACRDHLTDSTMTDGVDIVTTDDGKPVFSCLECGLRGGTSGGLTHNDSCSFKAAQVDTHAGDAESVREDNPADE